VGKLHFGQRRAGAAGGFKGNPGIDAAPGRLKFKKAALIKYRPAAIVLAKRLFVAAELDKNSREYHRLCGDVAKRIEEEVRKLSKENGN